MEIISAGKDLFIVDINKIKRLSQSKENWIKSVQHYLKVKIVPLWENHLYDWMPLKCIKGRIIAKTIRVQGQITKINSHLKLWRKKLKIYLTVGWKFVMIKKMLEISWCRNSFKRWYLIWETWESKTPKQLILI